MNPSFVLLYASAGLVTAARSTENSGKQHTDAYLPSRHPTALEPTLTPTAAAHSRSTAAPRSLQAIQADMQGAHWVDEKCSGTDTRGRHCGYLPTEDQTLICECAYAPVYLTTYMWQCQCPPFWGFDV
ncbi:hypothetical protein PgNI_10909 [Pyricularia grisea]|uniref:Uncharacterized protein n=1 Tax=Pyricularia grisea TaxID=148305 RepID=A0A6P8AXK8_PYRGI|nr:hypothetical protein PgNI_10909 [Pyricularia grisea]TLD07080.1 hypothetical protein PgNI_10909 [Pyricularia grisea]